MGDCLVLDALSLLGRIAAIEGDARSSLLSSLTLVFFTNRRKSEEGVVLRSSEAFDFLLSQCIMSGVITLALLTVGDRDGLATQQPSGAVV